MLRSSSCLFWGLVIFVVVSFTEVTTSFAARPFITEDAAVGERGSLQVEVSWDKLQWGNGDQEDVLLVVPSYGLTDHVELSLEAPLMFHHPVEGDSALGIGDINITGKILWLEEGDRSPALALKGVFKMKNGDVSQGLGSGGEDGSLVGVASKSWGKLTAHSSVGYTWVGKNGDENMRDIYLYGLALDYAFLPQLHFVTEVAGNRHPDRQSVSDPLSYLFGFTYQTSDRLVFDSGIRLGVNEAVPHWNSSFGCSFSF